MYHTCTALFPPGLSAGTSAQTVALPALLSQPSESLLQAGSCLDALLKAVPMLIFPASSWNKKACRGVEFTVVGLLKCKNHWCFPVHWESQSPSTEAVWSNISLVQHLIPLCLGSACFPPLASWMATLRLCCCRHIGISKPNRLAEAVPPLSLNLHWETKHFISPGDGNMLSLHHHRGMLSWHSSIVLSDDWKIPRAMQLLGQVFPVPRELSWESRLMQNTKPLIRCPSPCSCKLLPCSEFRMKYCI